MSKPLLAVLVGVIGLTVIVLVGAVAFIAFTLGRQGSPLADCKHQTQPYLVAIHDPLGRFALATNEAKVVSDTQRPAVIGKLKQANLDLTNLPYPTCVAPQRLLILRAVNDMLVLYSVSLTGWIDSDAESIDLGLIESAVAQIQAAGQ